MLRSDCEVYFDSPNGRLVYTGSPADEAYWDGHWAENLSRKIARPDRFVVAITKKYLRPGSKVVDAGCGLARTVYGLHSAGYEAYGVDYASATVNAINKAAPDLRVSLADVRDMRMFNDGFFDGVWSLGVIEHFYDGYDAIVLETKRLVRPGGYAFVTVPSMSPLRKLKARLGSYPKWDGTNKENFYQFVLQPKKIIQDFEATGFRLVATQARGGYKGFKDEVDLLRPAMQSVYNNRTFISRIFLQVIDRILTPFAFHTKLYVFQRIE